MKAIYNKVGKAIKGLLPLFLAATLIPSFIACSNDNDIIGSGDQSKQMVINKIFLEDATAKDAVYDREVTFARLGQLLRIEGSGFLGLKKIYVNGYETYFNNALLTDNNVWVTLKSDTPVDKAEADVRNTIRFVKDNTETVYDFVIRAASPSISGIDNSLPMAGETVTVSGANLQEISKITFPDGYELTEGITSDEDGEWYSFTMPEGDHGTGSLTAEGANGTAITPAYFNNNDCYIINFDGKGTQGSWNATFSSDDLVDDPLNSGRGKVCMVLPQSVLDEGGIKAAVSSSKAYATAGNDDADDDWNRMTSYISGTTPVDSVALQFDVYCPDAWDLSGQIEFSIQNNLSNYGYGSASTKYSADYKNQAYAWVPWLNRETGDHKAFTTGERWQTITIPLSEFGNYTETEKAGPWTFQNVIDDKNAGSYRNFMIYFCNPDLEYSEKITYPSSLFNQKIYIDNLRIVPISAITVSDF